MIRKANSSLVNVRGQDGEYLVKSKRVTGFTNAEEEAMGLTAVVPFLLEDRLKERGGPEPAELANFNNLPRLAWHIHVRQSVALAVNTNRCFLNVYTDSLPSGI